MTISSPPIRTTVPANPDPARTSDTRKPQTGHQADGKRELDRAILESSLNSSLSSGNQPLAVLYAAAIENLNAALAPELGNNAIQRAYEAGIDVSPEATAGRIVGMSTAFFGAYRELHPELDLESALGAFRELIAGGIERGFAEARAVLDGLGVLSGDIAENIDKTYDIVQQGLDDFVKRHPRSDQPS